MMDFSKFRESGELSDISVVVDGKEHKLHKFPLFIKSDFFRALARSKLSEKDRVELADFPGGESTFEMVANYCYNIKIDVTRHNVCKLRCAAEFLQMNSSANLADLTDRFLQDTLTSAKLARSLGVIVDLLLQCCTLGAIAEQAKIVERCIAAIVDCWLIATKFNKRTQLPDRYDVDILKQLTALPLAWFRQLFTTARDKSVRCGVLATMLELYVNASMGAEDELRSPRGDEKTMTAVNDGKVNDPPCAEMEKAEVDQTSVDEETQSESEESKQTPDEGLATKAPPVDVKEVLDSLVTELPDTQLMAEAVSPAWAVRVLCEADQLHCLCRDRLFHMVARMFPRMSPENLAMLSPELLCEIVQEAANEDRSTFRPDVVSATIDQYLLDLAAQNRLSVDVFSRLAQAVPREARDNHDVLFQVLEVLLKTEKPSLDESDKRILLQEVDFSRLSESILQRAYDAELVPVAYVTQAALALCSRLRAELEDARRVIRNQEDELEKYGLGGAGQCWLKRTDAARNLDLPGISQLERPSGGGVSLNRSDPRRSMESLDRMSTYSGFTRAEFTSPLHYGSYRPDPDRSTLSVSATADRYTPDIYRRHQALTPGRWS